MAMIFITPVEITPGATGWQDADLSAYLSAGASGAILHFVNTTATAYAVGWRKNGSADNRTQTIGYTAGGTHFWCTCGVDGNRILELNVGHITNVDVYLVGYFGSESVFFTNAIDKSIARDSTYHDVDISADTGSDTAIGAFLEVIATNGAFSVRKNGSTDNFGYKQQYQHGGVVVGVDGSEIFEAMLVNSGDYIYLNGYMKSGAVFNTNATNMSLGSTGAWTDLSALPEGALGCFMECLPASGSWADNLYGLRKNGSVENIYANIGCHPYAIVECDENWIIEGKIASTDVKFYLTGYPTPVPSTTFVSWIG